MSDPFPKRKPGWEATIKGMPRVGDAAERSRTTTMKDIEAFTEITGDRNPLHYDRALAERSVMGKLIVQGGVTSGILNALVAEDLPGPGNRVPRLRVEIPEGRGCRRDDHGPR